MPGCRGGSLRQSPRASGGGGGRGGGGQGWMHSWPNLGPPHSRMTLGDPVPVFNWSEKSLPFLCQGLGRTGLGQLSLDLLKTWPTLNSALGLPAAPPRPAAARTAELATSAGAPSPATVSLHTCVCPAGWGGVWGPTDSWGACTTAPTPGGRPRGRGLSRWWCAW